MFIVNHFDSSLVLCNSAAHCFMDFGTVVADTHFGACHFPELSLASSALSLGCCFCLSLLHYSWCYAFHSSFVSMIFISDDMSFFSYFYCFHVIFRGHHLSEHSCSLLRINFFF